MLASKHWPRNTTRRQAPSVSSASSACFRSNAWSLRRRRIGSERSGRGGTRTPDHLRVMQVLYHLSYTPERAFNLAKAL